MLQCQIQNKFKLPFFQIDHGQVNELCAETKKWVKQIINNDSKYNYDKYNLNKVVCVSKRNTIAISDCFMHILFKSISLDPNPGA